MKRFLLATLALAAVLAPSALAVTGSVGVTSTATNAVCNGTSVVTVTLQTVAPPPESAPLDLVIAIDDSGSLTLADFNLEKQAAIDFVNALDFAGGVRKVGVLKFADNGQTVISLSNNKASVVTAINSIAHIGGFTNITDAIRDARAMVTGPGSQAGADKVLLLITDGQNNREVDLLDDEYNAFKALPGEIFALGFGTASVSQLNAIASDPDSTHVYLTPDPAELSGLATDIAETIQNPAATNIVVRTQVAAPFVPVAGSNTHTFGSSGPLSAPGNPFAGFGWIMPELDTETQTLSFQVSHTGTEDGTFAALSVLEGEFTDSEGVRRPLSGLSPSITITGCNRPPVADAGPDQPVSLSGSPTAVVSMDGSGSSDPDGDSLSYSWSIGGSEVGTGATPSMPLGLGSHLITLTVTDPEGLSDTDEVLVTVVDPSPPAITPHVAGTLGSNGWYTSDVGVSWTVVDNESPTTTSGCDPSSVTSDTAGVSFTCSATSAGGSASETATVKRDATAPTVAYAGNQPSYLVTDTIAITCSASDAMSGLASSSCAPVSGPATSFLGLNTRSATAVDNAGNSATATITFTVAATVASLCDLTEQYVEHHGVAHSLCVKLGHGSIEPYVNEVNAQRGKRLTNAEADLLILLARSL